MTEKISTPQKVGALTFPNIVVGIGNAKMPYDDVDKGLKISEYLIGAFGSVMIFLKLAADVAVTSALINAPLLGFLGLAATRFFYRLFRQPTIADAYKGRANLTGK